MEKKNNSSKKVLTIVLVIFGVWLLTFAIFKSFDSDKVSDSENKIAIIPIIGEINTGESSDIFSTASVASSGRIISDLDKASKDKSVKAIVLEINSPGGTVVASREVAEKIKSMDKPVVSWIREIGTSGAYWIASSTDEIIADPLSMTGSIGVIGSYLEFTGLMEKYGVKYEGLTSGKYKDTGSPFKDLSVEERSIMQLKINMIHEAFVDEIASNRGLDKSKVSQLATGMFYLGTEAKDLGLVDELGGKDLAVKRAKEIAGIEDAEEIRYEQKKGLIAALTAMSGYPAYYIGRGIGYEIATNVEKSRFELNAL